MRVLVLGLFWSQLGTGFGHLQFPAPFHVVSGLSAQFDIKERKNAGFSKHAKTPEGILKRIRKHRAKATATYQITQSINHTEEEPYGWRSLAKARYKKYGNKDQLEDCYLVTINPKDHENLVEDEKNKLWFIENLISSNEHDVIKKILSLIPGDNLLKDWVSFNDITTGTAHKHEFVYNFG